MENYESVPVPYGWQLEQTMPATNEEEIFGNFSLALPLALPQESNDISMKSSAISTPKVQKTSNGIGKKKRLA